MNSETPSPLLDTLVEQIAYQKGIFDAAMNLLCDRNNVPTGTYYCNCCDGVLEVGEGQTCTGCYDRLTEVIEDCVTERKRIIDKIAEHHGQTVAALWQPDTSD